MDHLTRFKKGFSNSRLAPTLTLVAVVLLASWMGGLRGGYYASEWTLVAVILAGLLVLASATGLLRASKVRWSTIALGLFAAYTAWTFASLLWSPNQGDAWLGAGQTLLYLLVIWVSISLIRLGASRRWVLAASVIGPTTVAVLTLLHLTPRLEDYFENTRLVGTVGYYNGEAAFLLLPFWVAMYLAGSPSINPVFRAATLAGITLNLELAVLTQSRGAMVAIAASLPIFFLLSGQRLRGLLALIPVVVALVVSFPVLNGVYLEFLNQGTPVAAVDRVFPLVWLTAAGAGLYGLCWGLADQRWTPPRIVVRVAGGIALACSVIVILVGIIAVNDRFGSPAHLAQERWEAFKTNDTTGQDQSRFLSASGTGRYPLWQVAWEDFTSNPALGVGTYNYEATYYQRREQVAGYVRQPHMLPLEVLAERGAVGGALFFGFIATCLVAGLHQRFSKLNAQGKAQVGALVAAVAYWLVHSSAEWFWQLPAITMPIFVYLAVLVLPWQRIENTPLRWPLRTAGAVIAALAIISILPLYVSDYYLARSNDATAEPKEALAAIEEAQRFNPVDPRLFQREAELAIQLGHWRRAETAYQEASRLNPKHYAPYAVLAEFYAMRGDHDKALDFYQEATKRNPLDRELDSRIDRLEDADVP